MEKYTKLLAEKEELLQLLQHELLEMNLANAKLTEENEKQQAALGECACQTKTIDIGENIYFGDEACLTQYEVEEIEKKHKGSPSKFVRLLLRAMIPKATLSKYSACGKRQHCKLPTDLILSLEKFVTVRFPMLSHISFLKIVNQVCYDSRAITKRMGKK